MEGALIHDAEICKKRVLDMVLKSKVMSVDNNEVSIQADSICIHGDNPAAFEVAVGIYHSLIEQGIQIKKVGK